MINWTEVRRFLAGRGHDDDLIVKWAQKSPALVPDWKQTLKANMRRDASERACDIFEERFLSAKPITHAEVAAHYKITKQRAEQLVAQAFNHWWTEVKKAYGRTL